MKYDSCVSLHDAAKQIDWKDVKARLKPGSHILSIIPPLQHHIVTAAMEDSGIEIRDSILFLSTPGYVVSLGRVPLDGTVAQNVLRYGVGGLNIDHSRIVASSKDVELQRKRSGGVIGDLMNNKVYSDGWKRTPAGNCLGRWPSNVIISDNSAIKERFPDSKGGSGNGNAKIGEPGKLPFRRGSLIPRNDSGSAARFFHTVKEDDCLRGLITYLQKLITPPNGITMWLVPEGLRA